MIDSITAVILAGGKSTRMGQNKALLLFDGKPLIEKIRELLTKIFSKIIVSTALKDSYPQLELPEVVDRYPETGPLGGITSVLEAGFSPIFCVGCDMPFLSEKLIVYQCGIRACCDAVIPVWNNHPQVLHGLYSKSLLPAFHNGLNEEQYKITDWLEEAEVCYLLEDEIRRYDPSGLSFRNINTPDDYKSLESHLTTR
jgi:molybdopterin-guanine dinucleotide biosynthesis protein A